MDRLCKELSELSIDYDECHLLLNAKYTPKNINDIRIRYQRYLDEIEYWRVDNTSYDNIKNNIIFYMSQDTTKENINLILELAKIIDEQLKKILKKHKIY